MPLPSVLFLKFASTDRFYVAVLQAGFVAFKPFRRLVDPEDAHAAMFWMMKRVHWALQYGNRH